MPPLDSSDISSAISDLTERLKLPGKRPNLKDLLRATASDWSVPEDVLKRLFEKQHGQDLASYAHSVRKNSPRLLSAVKLMQKVPNINIEDIEDLNFSYKVAVKHWIWSSGQGTPNDYRKALRDSEFGTLIPKEEDLLTPEYIFVRFNTYYKNEHTYYEHPKLEMVHIQSRRFVELKTTWSDATKICERQIQWGDKRIVPQRMM